MESKLNRTKTSLNYLTNVSLQLHRVNFNDFEIIVINYFRQVQVLSIATQYIGFFHDDKEYINDSLSIQQNELSQLVSKTNTITKVTINEEITLENIQLVTAVFSRMEYLTINLFRDDLEPIGRFLLSKPNNNTLFIFIMYFEKTSS